VSIKEDEVDGHIECMGEMGNAYNIFTGKPEEKILLGKARRRLRNNIKMDLREILCATLTGFKIETSVVLMSTS
jgi:hypothetical protein